MLIPWQSKRAPLSHLYVNFCWKTCKEKQNWNRKNFQVFSVIKKTVVNIITLSFGYQTACFLRMNCGFKFLHIFEAYDFLLENSLAVCIHLNSHQHYMSVPVCVLFKIHIWTFSLFKGSMHHQRYLLIKNSGSTKDWPSVGSQFLFFWDIVHFHQELNFF